MVKLQFWKTRNFGPEVPAVTIAKVSPELELSQTIHIPSMRGVDSKII
jgi:hypothetical protein